MLTKKYLYIFHPHYLLIFLTFTFNFKLFYFSFINLSDFYIISSLDNNLVNMVLGSYHEIEMWLIDNHRIINSSICFSIEYRDRLVVR